MSDIDTRHAKVGFPDEYIRCDEVLDCFGIEKATFYEKVKKTGLKPPLE